ncbi:MAG TPA: hypothetical protein VFY04_07265 [Solirubrobacterales bacterium]|nr:hypothetical protein [Solirubrobacterales bacterium]
MSMVRSLTKTAVDRSLKLTRLPLDMAIGVAGASRSPAKLAVDRMDAAVRGAAGAVLGDRQMQGEAKLREAAAEERERAMKLREESERREAQAAERRRKEEQAAARRRQKAEQAAKKAAAERDKRAKAAKLESLDAKEEALAAKEQAAAKKREAARVKKAAAKAKAERKRKS